MGQEARCVGMHQDKTSVGKALLETDELIFRGDFRVALPLAALTEVTAADGRLRVSTGTEALELELGPQAEKWAHRIRNPRTLIDKLDVKPGQRVSLLRMTDAAFLEQLRQRTTDLHDGAPAADSDWIFLGVEEAEELGQLAGLREYLKPAGGIWVVSPRGRRDLQDLHVFAAAKAAGLVDTKVARFSETHTANKLVILRALRG